MAQDLTSLIGGCTNRFRIPIHIVLLPEVVPGFEPPFRLCPPDASVKLTNGELTYYRKISHPLPTHFVLADVDSSTSSNHGIVLEEVLEEAPKWLSCVYKFDDERVTKEYPKWVLEEQYGGEEELLTGDNPGFNNTPFKFTKY
ncbi:hypothetical protein TSUD_242590 [Trifolium subterraneum]|uniref:Uncharacterized protein n=1 Tax=Trifolium subterraneum TaxID=3900 RepID=A0A2Z6LUV1_TRISU|nr:hypothetical protein TSUD_242590 [Trifolium subterraneum]